MAAVHAAFLPAVLVLLAFAASAGAAPAPAGDPRARMMSMRLSPRFASARAALHKCPNQDYTPAADINYDGCVPPIVFLVDRTGTMTETKTLTMLAAYEKFVGSVQATSFSYVTTVHRSGALLSPMDPLPPLPSVVENVQTMSEVRITLERNSTAAKSGYAGSGRTDLLAPLKAVAAMKPAKPKLFIMGTDELSNVFTGHLNGTGFCEDWKAQVETIQKQGGVFTLLMVPLKEKAKKKKGADDVDDLDLGGDDDEDTDASQPAPEPETRAQWVKRLTNFHIKRLEKEILDKAAAKDPKPKGKATKMSAAEKKAVVEKDPEYAAKVKAINEGIESFAKCYFDDILTQKYVVRGQSLEEGLNQQLAKFPFSVFYKSASAELNSQDQALISKKLKCCQGKVSISCHTSVCGDEKGPSYNLGLRQSRCAGVKKLVLQSKLELAEPPSFKVNELRCKKDVGCKVDKRFEECDCAKANRRVDITCPIARVVATQQAKKL